MEFISSQYMPRDSRNHYIFSGFSLFFRCMSWRKARRFDDVKAYYNL